MPVSRDLRNRKTTKATPAKSSPPVQTQASSPDEFFPFARYISATGVHACLLAFTALVLPRTSPSFVAHFAPSWHQNAEPADFSLQGTLSLLTRSPVRTVLWTCVGAAVLQAWWASCLQEWLLESRMQKRGVTDAAEKPKQKLDKRASGRRQLETLKNASLTTLVAHPVQTYSLALLLALLTAWTPAYVYGPPSLGTSTEALVIRLTWIRLFAELRPRGAIERAIVYPAIGSLFGCWSGAIPIALDWDRPWQAWPLTPAYGAISGYILGSLVAVSVSGITHLALADLLSAQTPAKKESKSRQR
ncbi:uncharacterized protein FIBRA_04058 [Fibroporia radiculosa]|uniref:Uncharacterized protein n=1 Tax=Fibroporia radiculosa TaxID=599839 RepID=J4H2R5_9APHY|nr:uncharacterized protein FIBRA_04058 [Fibroporia radiculosa]CCM01984.1 predicted protein [Fibroporia radiculosa]